MGLFDRFSRKSQSATPLPTAARPTTESRPRVEVDVQVQGPSADGLAKVSGTTTFGKDAVASLLDRHAQGERGMLLVNGSLRREPENTADPAAIAIHVEGERIGYLPGYVAQVTSLAVGASRQVPLQFFFARQANGKWRGEAWTWLSDGEPQWQYTETSPPPLSAAERRQASAASTDRMIAEAMEQGGSRAAQFQDAAVNGIHFLQTAEPIQELKRQGRLDDALALCFVAIESAEKGRDGREPAPWYTEQAAIILRKLGRRDEEVAVLQRWLSLCPPHLRDGSRLGLRLAKLTGSSL